MIIKYELIFNSTTQYIFAFQKWINNALGSFIFEENEDEH